VPIIVDLYVAPLETASTPSEGVVRAGIPDMDDCPILTRLKAFLVDQGVQATLEHTLRDRTGNPVDLTTWFGTSSDSLSSSSQSSSSRGVRLRVKEWLGESLSSLRNPVWEVTGEVVSAQGGTVRATLDAETVARAGIYELNWAVVDGDGEPVLVDRGILSVEKSMFAPDLTVVKKNLGPPTLQEVRMRMMDSSASENLLLDDVEFRDEQILLALSEPVREWNESLPPIKTFTTRDFPFRGAWITGALGQLHLMAANHYRRNRLQHQAGGVSVDDKNKEREYLAEGQRLWDKYTTWMTNKKVSINMKLVVGNVHSIYVTRNGW
jgi:hypothetical protein